MKYTALIAVTVGLVSAESDTAAPATENNKVLFAADKRWTWNANEAERTSLDQTDVPPHYIHNLVHHKNGDKDFFWSVLPFTQTIDKKPYLAFATAQ